MLGFDVGWATIVAALAAFAGPLAALFVSQFRTHQRLDEAQRRIGEPNGKGNVVQMSEKTLQGLDDIKDALILSRNHLDAQDRRIDRVVDSVAALSVRVDGLAKNIEATATATTPPVAPPKEFR